MLRQRPVKGGRQSIGACVIKQIEDHIEYLAKRHDASKSFIIAVALASAFNIEIGDSYVKYDRKTRKTSNRLGIQSTRH